MLVCDRCESKKEVSSISAITAKVANTAVPIIDANKPVDLCRVCLSGLQGTVATFLQPLDKTTKAK